jgi:hypothetical protein
MFKRLAVAGLCLLTACGPRGRDRAEPEPPEADKPVREEKAAPARSPTLHRSRDRDGVATSTPTAPPTVLLIITDTVRADHTSLCGYARPTTPFLQKLVEEGATHTCLAFAPGTWTLPSHGSYFTGVSPTVHGLLNKGQPLARDFETLAEIFRAAGYQTAMISANPTLSRASGVWQGFDVVNIPVSSDDAFRGKDFVGQLGLTLDGLAADKPLFLVVNLFDAHDPYPTIPEDAQWVPPRKGIFLNPVKVAEGHPARRYVDGELNAEERRAFLEHVTDVYDYGISLADRNVRKTMKLLSDRGWLDEGYRLVVTSDHGENLGDHDQIRHGGPPWSSVATVFTLFHDTTLPTQPTLPEPFPNLHVFHLARDGRLPATPEPALSGSIEFNEARESHRADAVALWAAPDRKILVVREQPTLLRPISDPGELQGAPVADDDPDRLTATAEYEALMRSKAEALGRGDDPEMLKTLQAIGYLD